MGTGEIFLCEFDKSIEHLIKCSVSDPAVERWQSSAPGGKDLG